MPDKKSITLIVVLLFLSLAVTSMAYMLYVLYASATIVLSPSRMPSSWNVSPSLSVERAYHRIEDGAEQITATGYDLDRERSALLISKKSLSSQHTAHVLWLYGRGREEGVVEGARHIRTIDTSSEHDEVTLEKKGTTIILNHYKAEDLPRTQYRYVYSIYGELLLVSDEEPEQSKAVFRTYADNSELNFPVELVFKDTCTALGSSKRTPLFIQK